MLLGVNKVRLGVVDQERAQRFWVENSMSRELVGRGVSLVQEPVDMPFGRWAMFEDGEGNRFPLTAR